MSNSASTKAKGTVGKSSFKRERHDDPGDPVGRASVNGTSLRNYKFLPFLAGRKVGMGAFFDFIYT